MTLQTEDIVDSRRARETRMEQLTQRKVLHALAEDTTLLQTRPVHNEKLPASVGNITEVHNVETEQALETQNRCISTSL